MDTRFLTYNIQQQDPEHFSEMDTCLSTLKPLPHTHVFHLLEELPSKRGIYTLIGGGLTGKTTLLKQWIVKLIRQGTLAQAIAFFPCETIHDDDELIQLVQKQLNNNITHTVQYLLFDNVTHLRNWDKALEYLCKADILKKSVVMLTSSDAFLSQKVQAIFSHRYKKIRKNSDFHLSPLSFREVVLLKNPGMKIQEINLFNEYEQYLLHGGYLVAINDMAVHGKILDETLKKYTDWLKAEMLRQRKNEEFLFEILTAVIKHYTNEITWNTLSQELSINHPSTIAEYILLLEMLDVVFIQYALLENTLSAAPKKARKLMFLDPFIFHAITAWLNPKKDFFNSQIKSQMEKSEFCSSLAEACVITHYSRFYATYYIKAEGRIDLAYIKDQTFWPVIVTWNNQVRPKSLKQIQKYNNGKILTKTHRSGIIESIRTEPLPLVLWKLENEPAPVLTSEGTHYVK